MPTVELTEDVYRTAVERSVAGGFASVSDYIGNVMSQDADGATPDLNDLFTPERMAHIAAGQADLAAGRTYTSAELDAAFTKRRAEWLKRP